MGYRLDRASYLMADDAHAVVRHRATVILALACGSMAVLDHVGLLAFTVPANNQLLGRVADHPTWEWAFTSCALAIAVTLHLAKGRRYACGAASGLLFAWSGLTLLWGLDAAKPVSLAGPTMGLVVALLAYYLTGVWEAVWAQSRSRAIREGGV